jgi:signal transduction histidine kinase
MNVSPAVVPVLVALGVACLVSLAVSAWVHRRFDTPATRPLAVVFATVGLHAAVGVIHLLFAASPVVTAVAAGLELWLGALAAVLWLTFAATYTGWAPAERRGLRWLLGGYLVATVGLLLTNGLHGLVHTAFVRETAPFVHYEVVKGVGHYLVSVLGYVPFVLGTVLLVRLLAETPAVGRAAGALVVGALSIAATNALPYLVAVPVEYSPLYIPVGATAFAVAAVVAVRADLFAVRPIARGTVLAAIEDPIVTLDTAGGVVDANPAFVAAFTDGDDEHDVVHRPLAAVAPCVAAAVDDEDWAGSLTLQCAAGRRHYSVSDSPVGSGTRRLGRTLVFRDVTEAVRSREELERQNTQLDDLALSAAHNIRNPLGAISGFAELVADHCHAVEMDGADPDPAMVSAYLTNVVEGTGRLDAVVTDFLRVLREGKTVERAEPTSLGRVLGGLRPAGSDLTVAVDRDGVVDADPGRLGLLLDAALRSAADRAEGPVTVRASLTDDGFVLEDDAGPLTPGECEMLLQHGRTSTHDTSGMGLVVARVVAGVHGWTVRADPGESGLRLVVEGARTWPAAVRRLEPSSASSPVPTPTGR